MGFTAERRRFGWYRTNTEAPEFAAVTVTSLAAHQVDEFLADVRSYFGDRRPPIDLTTESYSLEVADALSAAGFDVVQSVYLAHVGALPDVASSGVSVVPASSLRDFGLVKLMSFADSEEQPDAAELAREVSMREAEATGEGRFRVAMDGDEIAAICGFYEGPDYGIFILGTRVPFRRRGIASVLLRSVLEEARDAGARSVIIWCDAGGEPEKLYRKLGFSDEFHRRWRFTKSAT